MSDLVPVLPRLFSRKPEALQRNDEAWAYPRATPEGNATVPSGLPPCGTVGQGRTQRRNLAARFLERRGWYSHRKLARLLNANARSLRFRMRDGRVPHLRVGARSWWVPPDAVDGVFQEFGDPVAYRAWIEAGRPLRVSFDAIGTVRDRDRLKAERRARRRSASRSSSPGPG